MKLRLRLLPACFALFALSLWWVEGAWASSCQSGMAMESGVAASAEMGGMAGMPMDCSAAGGAHQNGSGQDGAPRCPLGTMAVAGACVAAPSLPPSGMTVPAPAPEGALLLVSPDPMRDLLSVSAFFRPPRA